VLTRLFTARLPWRQLFRRTALEISHDNCLGLAAQLAYYFFLALFPALLFLVALASFFPVDRLVPRLIETAHPFLPGDVVTIISDQLVKIAEGNNAGLLTFGFVAALWSSSAALTAIIDALNRAYDVEEGRPWWRVRLTAIGLTLMLALFVLVSFALIAIGPDTVRRLPLPGEAAEAIATGWALLRWPVAFALIAVAIGLTYYFAPDVEQEWVWLTPGSLAATVAWILASLAFKIYLVNFGTYTETYGAIGGVMILLLWLYISGLAILAGAELNAEIEHAAPEGKDPGEKVPGQLPRVPGVTPSAVPVAAGAASSTAGAPAIAAGTTSGFPWPLVASGALVLAGVLTGRSIRRAGK
jgi:membrane protein